MPRLRAAPLPPGRYVLARPVLDQAKALVATSERTANTHGLLVVDARSAFTPGAPAAIGWDAYIGYLSSVSKPDAQHRDNVIAGRFRAAGRINMRDGQGRRAGDRGI